MMFVGKRKRRMFKMSDRVHIRVLRADIDRRQIDFGLTEFESEDGEPQTQKRKPFERDSDEEPSSQTKGKFKRGRGKHEKREKQPGKKRRVDRGRRS
jgi:ribonuclease R